MFCYCFSQNGNIENPYCNGIQGILEAYHQSLKTVQLYGPTNFAPVVNHVARYKLNISLYEHIRVQLSFQSQSVNNFQQADTLSEVLRQWVMVSVWIELNKWIIHHSKPTVSANGKCPKWTRTVRRVYRWDCTALNTQQTGLKSIEIISMGCRCTMFSP